MLPKYQKGMVRELKNLPGISANAERIARRAIGVCLLLALGLFLGAFSGVSNAGNRALLIATTSYEDPIQNLPGLELDLQQMERFTRKLGFEPEEIKTLVDADVTLENIQRHFAGFLSEGVDADDTILIYYTGHGMQVPDRSGDEDDRRDEAISMYNLAPAVSGWDGILVDDEFSALLRTLPSENVVVVVDACHSGTVTRSFSPALPSTTRAFTADEFAVKALPYRGDGDEGDTFVKNPGSITDEIPEGVVSLSAAQDDQLSLASKQGSLFTLALSQALDAQRSDASPESLVRAATSILDAQLNDDLMFLPNLSGDNKLFTKRLVIENQVGRPQVNWSDLLLFASGLDSIDVSSTQSSYSINEPIELNVTLPEAGYINIVAVDANDEMVLLFPNAIDVENWLPAGQHDFPGDRDFEWVAQPPWGNTMVTTLYSPKPINLYSSSTQRLVNGEPMSDFVLPSLAGLMEVQLNKRGGASDVLFVKTCESESQC